jgi:hypothetical protein
MTKVRPFVSDRREGCAWQPAILARNSLGKANATLYILHQGVPAHFCRRAFARFMEQMAVGTLFLLSILRDMSEGNRGRLFFFH